MPTTYTPLATTTLNSNQSSVTFSGISGAYTDLVLVVNAYQNSNSPAYLRVNGLNTSIYSNTWVRGDGTSATSARYNTAALGGSGFNLDNFSALPPFPSDFSGQATYHIMNYSNTTTNKTVLLRHGSSNWTIANVGLIQTTSAITSLEVYPFATTWASGSTFSLYGVASAAVVSGAKATGGDSVYTDGTYWYHTFLSSGTFTPTQALTADYLVVAGGGGAAATASYYVGGGGAGGLRCTVGATGGGGSLESAVSLTNGTAYTITVGAGGAGGNTTGAPNGISGSNSSISGTGLTTITSTGGGSSTGSVPNTGGSGGGGTINNNGAAGTANQGYAGGNGSGAGVAGAGGGGGGAGGAGTNGNGATNTGGNGGAGVTTAISGTSTSYAGGGGGTSNAAGGTATAGGGAGKTTGTANSGTANTGGGGGGTNNFNGGSGGSGIVIIRYAA